jgi:hypothetical protein
VRGGQPPDWPALRQLGVDLTEHLFDIPQTHAHSDLLAADRLSGLAD